MEKVCVLIPSPAHAEVFLLPGPTGWALPEIAPPAEIYNLHLGEVNELIHQQLGAEVITLHTIRLPDPSIPGPVNILTAALQQREWTPPATGRWIGQEQFAVLPLASPRQQAVLRNWFVEAEGQPLPTLDLPWWKPDWFGRASRWLHSLEDSSAEPVEQLRSAYTSAIVRRDTSEGRIYLKAIPSPFTHEIAVTQALAVNDPAHFPAIVATNLNERWIVIHDMGTRNLPQEESFERWKEVVRTYGRIQAASSNQPEQWLALGCADLSLEQMAAQLERMIDEAPIRLQGLAQHLTADELAQLRARVPRLQALCVQLREYGIPSALVHGDFHAGNIMVPGEQGTIYYDWSHSCLSHPFFDLEDLLADDDWFPTQPEAKAHLRTLYLEAWTDRLPMERLQEAFLLAQRLYRLYRAFQSDRILGAYQQMLGGHEYLPDTPTGTALQTMQWWMADQLRQVIQQFAVPE